MSLTFLSGLLHSQLLTDKYLHFKKDYYWDTICYRSVHDYYYENNNRGHLVEKKYPVKEYLFSTILNNSPLVTKDSFQIKNSSAYPFRYVKKENAIYLEYYDKAKKRLQRNKEYSLLAADTVENLAEKGTLGSENGISVSGFSVYKGVKNISINNVLFSTYCFFEFHEISSESIFFTNEIYLEKRTLIPIKTVTVSTDKKYERKDWYSIVTNLISSSQILADYSEKTAEDMTISKNTNITWSEKQKEEFRKMFPASKQVFADCLISKLDGKISFFESKNNVQFKRIVFNKECE